MGASILDGRAVAAEIRGEVAARVRALRERGVVPGLAGVLVGADEASRIYLGSKHRACEEVGIVSTRLDLPGDISQDDLLAEIDRLNRDPAVHGIIVQIPVPPQISELALQTTIDPGKDVDGLHPLNVGLMVRGDPSFPPATPYGIVELLVRSGVPLEGAEVVVDGYGDLVGAPLSVMLSQDSIRGNATVTICHVRTRDVAAHTRRAADATSGRVLLYQGQPASVFYSAWCGGKSELASQVWPGAVDYSYEPAVHDDACEDEPGWTSEGRVDQVERALRTAGLRGTRLKSLRVLSRNASDRVARIALEGFTPNEMTGHEFRTAVGRVAGWAAIKSTAFEVDRTSTGYRFRGKGFGHGVGLCVIGAGKRGPITAKIQKRFFDVVNGKNAKYGSWLAHVGK